MLIGVALAAGILLWGRTPQREPVRSFRPSPTPLIPVAKPSPHPPRKVIDLGREAWGIHRVVLRVLPPDTQIHRETEEIRRDGTTRWPWWRYRAHLAPGQNVKAVLGQLVQEVEQEGGVLLGSRPEGVGQVVEFGMEYRGRLLPVLRLRLVPSEPSGPIPRPRVAFILDDAGGRLEELDRATRIGRPVALAILPGLPHSTELARRASGAGLDVLLHLPMEPEDPEKVRAMGPGGVYGEMSEEEIIRVVRSHLDRLPGVVGINNHMGSRGTSDPRVVRAVMRVVQERGLFFVDSRTSPRSVAEQVAEELKVPIAVRSVFLDNDPAPEAIRQQVRRAVALARRRGSALAIGHINRPHTAEVLREMVPEVEAEGVEIVSVRALLHRP
ncbi:MAG: divergent polysaccharide deacetylase family protein [Armatimonadetes bacterium]|nr:divergent polysaccharide deacetylase family protein [Armatimonadota bacterium]MDW8154845.1 divergent polysaccharide deacetylase family protein [Armatimonadota bacterium]